ncbi:MAG: hypothetical protein Tsb0021_04910 [Chlamydiales bacterium]
MSELIKNFNSTLKTALISMGFKNSKGIFLFPLDKEISGWLGISKGTRYGVISLTPLVGLTHRTIQDLDQRLRKVKPNKELFPVVTKPLTYISNQAYDPKLVETLEDIPVEVDRMIESIKLYALPFYEQNGNLENLLKFMIAGYGYPEKRRRVTPITHLLLGDKKSAISFVEKELENMRNETGPSRDEYETFAKNFFIYVNEGKLPPLEECRKI